LITLKNKKGVTMTEQVYIFDTTLRDGEQSPGASMNTNEKLRLAIQLEKLGVDVIEAGFPAASEGDFEAVSRIAGKLERTEVAALCRASKNDIDKAWGAIKNAAKPKIHTFIATSDIHLKYKLDMSRDQVVQAAADAVKYAKSLTGNIEFSAEDGSRSDRDFLCRVFGAAIEAGATVINLPDTVGYAIPGEFSDLVRYVLDHTPNMHKAVLSIHCHNDLGMVVAISVAGAKAAVDAGVDAYINTTINGIGERAGNADLVSTILAIESASKPLMNY
jgi:2-isopropylmalate synthase